MHNGLLREQIPPKDNEVWYSRSQSLQGPKLNKHWELWDHPVLLSSWATGDIPQTHQQATVSDRGRSRKLPSRQINIQELSTALKLTKLSGSERMPLHCADHFVRIHACEPGNRISGSQFAAKGSFRVFWRSVRSRSSGSAGSGLGCRIQLTRTEDLIAAVSMPSLDDPSRNLF